MLSGAPEPEARKRRCVMTVLKGSVKALLTAVILLAVMTAAAMLTPQEACAEVKLDEAYEGDTVFDTVVTSGGSDNVWSREIIFSADGDIEAYSDSSVFSYDQVKNNIFHITPLRAGNGRLILKDMSDDTILMQTITVEAGYFQNMLDNSVFIGFGTAAFDGQDVRFETTENVGYGEKGLPVSYPHSAGATASLFVDEVEFGPDFETYFDKDWGNAGDARKFGYVFNVRLGTPVRLHVEWRGASKDYTGKVVSRSNIKTYKIKKNSRKGKVLLYNVHAGDYLKIKVGKKYVKTVKIKADYPKKTVKWTNKKKMKKGAKVTYILYNKFKQKLKTAKRTVGR